MNRPLDSEFHEFADGRLSASGAMEIQAWLDEHAEDADMVNAWRLQKEMLQRSFANVAAEPLPESVRRAIDAAGARRWSVPRLAASIAWLATGIVIGFLVRGLPAASRADSAASLPRQAVAAHVIYSPEIRHPVEVGGDQEAHLVQWLSKRLGGAMSIPNLTAQGFRLVGGRLLPGENGPAAQFMYENKTGLRLTLYVRKSRDQNATAFRFASDGPLSVFYWVDGPFGYALSGELPREALLAVADATYRQLTAK
jgi:anti-sigma factor RsiW